MGVLYGCGLEDWLDVLCDSGGHVLFGSLLHVLSGGGGISLRNSMDK